MTATVPELVPRIEKLYRARMISLSEQGQLRLAAYGLQTALYMILSELGIALPEVFAYKRAYMLCRSKAKHAFPEEEDVVYAEEDMTAVENCDRCGTVRTQFMTFKGTIRYAYDYPPGYDVSEEARRMSATDWKYIMRYLRLRDRVVWLEEELQSKRAAGRTSQTGLHLVQGTGA